MVQVARDGNGNDSSNVMSWALVAAIDGNADLGRKAKDLAMKLANGPIRSGHVPFAYDLALGGAGLRSLPRVLERSGTT